MSISSFLSLPFSLTVKRSRLIATRVRKEVRIKIGKRLLQASKYPTLSPENYNNDANDHVQIKGRFHLQCIQRELDLSPVSCWQTF